MPHPEARVGAPPEILELVERYGRNCDVYRHGHYKEAELRTEFLDPFFESLGWDMANRQGYAEAYKDVVHEAAIKIGGGTKAPDYCMRAGGSRKFFVEAKRPALNIKVDVDAVFQLRRYAWSAKLPLGILTNFEGFAVYDCTREPAQLEDPRTARVLYVAYDEYDSRWHEISSVFSRDAVLKGLFDTYAASTRAKRGSAEVDDAFLAELDSWRMELAKNLFANNPSLAQRELNWAIQETIDRIVFLRICEDRGIEDYGKLRSAASGRDVYASLVALFRQADDKYNSGLFHFSSEPQRDPPDNLTPVLIVADGLLKRLLARLYYPDSPYEFSVLPPDILGQVYERFLGKTICVDNGRVSVQDRPEVAKAGGVYYTPTHVVDYIVRQTLRPFLDDAHLSQMRGEDGKPLRVIDPACGSGSFLLGAYQVLLDWYLDRYLAERAKWARGTRAAIREDGRGGWRLTTAERKAILLRHIYGVDLDAQAVEVTRLSLLLKVLEGETEETLQAQLAMFHARALPDLDKNIKCGNSLVSPDIYDDAGGRSIGDTDSRQINAFDWRAEFGDVLPGGGFDAVVGNPPWLMAGYYVKHSLPYFRSHYESATGKFDLYYLFLERALRVLAPTGRIGMIVPNKFFHTRAATSLRGALSAGRRLEAIADFGEEQVFSRATNYSCILSFGRVPSDEVRVSRVTADLTTTDTFSVSADSLTTTPWTLAGAQDGAVFARMRASSTPLKELASHFGNGVQTGADAVYVIAGSRASTLHLEPDALRPFFQGRDVRRYAAGASRAQIIFPYKEVGDRYQVMSEGELAPWSMTMTYLQSNRARLDRRVWFGKDAAEISGAWFGLMYVDRPTAFASQHLLVPALAKSPRFSLDTGSLFATGTAGVTSVVPKPNTSIRYLLAVLNSSAMAFYATRHSPVFRGGYHKFSRGYLEELPIPRLDERDETQAATRQRLEELVDSRLAVASDQASEEVPTERAALIREARRLDTQIDELVCALYGLDQSQMAFIEASEKSRLVNAATGRGTLSPSNPLDSGMVDPDEPS
jgi:hypothetical protein